ncbi:MAG TPA: hypothetical protein VFE14_16045, partial [Micromonosporaceae bacterium]|nr:hypothetical protein [Micromonosporaceae bacterium]
MPRRFGYLIAWGVATALTVGASWLGISSVLSAAVPARTTPLSAAELRRAAPTPALPPTSAASAAPSPAASPSPSVVAHPAPSSSPSPAGTGWIAEPDGRGGTAYRRTFRLQGGETTIWFARGEIRVLSAVAKTGYALDIDRPAVDSATVTFFSNRHRSRVAATWR